MEDKSWVKLYRKAKDNEIMRDQAAFLLFAWILLSVDRKTGKWKIGRFLLSKLTGMKPTTARDALYRLRDKYGVLTTLVTPTKYTEISVLKWAYYQQEIRLTPTLTPRSRHSTATLTPLNKNKRIRELDNDEEENLITSKKINSLRLTRGQMASFQKAFPGVTTTELKEQIIKCNTYMGMSSEVFKNPGLFFRKWLEKYWNEKNETQRKAKLATEQDQHVEMPLEQRERNLKRIAEIRKGIGGGF